MKQTKNCGNCMYGVRVSINNDILCRLKGVVSRDYSCGKHRMNPVRKPFIEVRSKCADCEFFILTGKNPDSPQAIGYCQLFTVREYAGDQKNACSKFCRKSEREVS